MKCKLEIELDRNMIGLIQHQLSKRIAELEEDDFINKAFDFSPEIKAIEETKDLLEKALNDALDADVEAHGIKEPEKDMYIIVEESDCVSAWWECTHEENIGQGATPEQALENCRSYER